MAYLETLAARFVEQDGLSTQEQDKIIADASDYVRFGQQQHRKNAGSPAMQLAQSIQRWVSSTNEVDEDNNGGGISDTRNIEKTARAHKFLSRTLKALPKATLQSREVKLFTTFFCAMYQLQDASISAVTEALTSLVWMDNFDPSSAEAVLSSIGSINPESFTKQLARTRLEIFNLIETLLGGRSGQYLQARHKESEHLLTFLKLAGRERDPSNLLQWFRILNTTLRQSNLSKEVADAAFDSFSPFFPISIRKSTVTSPEVTEKQLKDALSSCFAANGRLAHRAIPFLVEKLDGGVSMTASVKLDILRTIKECVKDYEPIDTYILPHIPQIWNSLKYEVRNGEIPEAIQETLSVFETASGRLSDHSSSTHVKDFVDTIWNDCAEDFLDNPAYTEQLGSILISVARAHLEPFRLISPRIINAVKRAIAQPNSPAHTKSLLLVLNNLLRARRHVVPHLTTTTAPATYGGEPVTLVRELYFKALQDSAVQDPTKEQVEIAKEACEGLAQIAQQRRPSDDGRDYTTDCDEDAFKEICRILTYHCLNAFNVQSPSPDSGRDAIETAAAEALRTTVQYYSQGYGRIVSGVLDEVAKRNWAGSPAERSVYALHTSVVRLSVIGCTAIPEDSPAIINFATFTGGMLKMLGMLFASQASLKTCARVLDAIYLGVQGFTEIGMVRTALEDLAKPGQEKTTWSLTLIETAVKDMLPTFPDLVKGNIDQFDPSQLTQLRSKALTGKDMAFVVPFLQLGVFVVAQLYQHATVEEDIAGANGLDLRESLKAKPSHSDNDMESQTLWRDRYLQRVGSIAATVLRELDVSAQMDLKLHEQILACFRSLKPGIPQQSCWSYHHDDMVSELSWGITHAIRPEVVLELHGSFHTILLGDLRSVSRLKGRGRLNRAGIATILANKYDTKTCNSTEDLDAWSRVLTEIEDMLSAPSTMAGMSLQEFYHIASILWGAITRGDRFVSKSLSEAISHVAVKSGHVSGIHMARELHQIFLPIGSLYPTMPPAHTIEKRLHKQWAYHHCVHPILHQAYPLQPESYDSVTYAIYVLHAVKHLTIGQYEGDADKILRIALAAMQKAEFLDVDAAFSVVLHIVNQDPKLVKNHVGSIVAASKLVYGRSARLFSEEEKPSAGDDDNSPKPWKTLPVGDIMPRPEMADDRAMLRVKSVRMLQTVAKQVDEQASRVYANDVVAHLETVLGDPRRQIRQLAQVAKSAWTQLLE